MYDIKYVLAYVDRKEIGLQYASHFRNVDIARDIISSLLKSWKLGITVNKLTCERQKFRLIHAFLLKLYIYNYDTIFIQQ